MRGVVFPLVPIVTSGRCERAAQKWEPPPHTPHTADLACRPKRPCPCPCPRSGLCRRRMLLLRLGTRAMRSSGGSRSMRGLTSRDALAHGSANSGQRSQSTRGCKTPRIESRPWRTLVRLVPMRRPSSSRSISGRWRRSSCTRRRRSRRGGCCPMWASRRRPRRPPRRTRRSSTPSRRGGGGGRHRRRRRESECQASQG